MRKPQYIELGVITLRLEMQVIKQLPWQKNYKNLCRQQQCPSLKPTLLNQQVPVVRWLQLQCRPNLLDFAQLRRFLADCRRQVLAPNAA